MDGPKQHTPDYEIALLSLARKCKAEIIQEYEKCNKKKKKDLYLQILTVIKEAIVANNLENLKSFCKLISIVCDVMHKETLKSYYRSGKKNLKITNLIILVCKHKNVNALEYIFDSESQVLDNLSVDIGVPFPQPSDKDEECHNAFYYAIRSKNVDLLNILIKKWPNHYLDTRSDELEEILSKAYDEIKLKNILLSDEMECFVENKLIDLRFFSDAPKSTERIKPSPDNVKERVGFVLEIIRALETEYTGEKDVDAKFLFSSRFIAQNIHILKRYLKPTYVVFPWEEMEFLLIAFITSATTHREINLICNSILTKKRILNHLTNFAKRLRDIGIKEADVGKALPSENRDTLVKQISDSYPAFEQLYNDYKQVADIYALDKISAYIDLALEANPSQENDRLVIVRALQVIGENLKNSLESPKLSSTLGELLLLWAPINTSEILRDLRNSLSHGLALPKKSESENDFDLFARIQNDLKKIGSVASNILVKNKIKMCRNFLKCIVESTDLQDIKKMAEQFCFITINKLTLKTFQTIEFENIKELIRQLDSLMDKKTGFDKAMIDEINSIFIAAENEEENDEWDYVGMISTMNDLRNLVYNTQIDDNNIKKILKTISNVLLAHTRLKIKPQNLQNITERIVAIADSARTRLQSDVANALVLRILYLAQFEMKNIGWIQKLQEKLTRNKFIKCDSKTNNDEPEENWSNKLKTKLSALENVLNSNRSNNHVIDNYPYYKNNEKMQAVLEIFVQDIISILSEKNILVDDLLFLEDNSPLLIGRSLRNHLAHGNALIDIMPCNLFIAVMSSARKFVSETMRIDDTICIGKLMKDIPPRLKEKYNQDLQIILTQEAMFQALEKGDLEALKNCTKKGADLNARNAKLQNALHFAAKGPNLNIVKSILSQNLISKDVAGKSPLHIAAAHGRKSIVEFFLEERGFKVDDTTKTNQTPLHFAAQDGHKDVVNVLLGAGARTLNKDLACYSPLHYAIANNHKDVLTILLGKEKNVDANEAGGGFTPLNLAAVTGRLEIVRFLIQSKANVNSKSDKNCTPLHAAALGGHFEIAQILISNGADVEAEALTDNCTPLHCAVDHGHEHIVNILLEHGADVNARDKIYHYVPLHCAARNGYKDIADILLKNKANVNVFTISGESPLHFAASAGHEEIVDLLLRSNASINAKTNDGLTALHLSSIKGYKDIVELLLKSGATIDSTDSRNKIPLILAARYGHTEIVELLITNGANIHTMDINCDTALHASSATGYKDVVEILIKKGAKPNAKNTYCQTPLHYAAIDFSDEKMSKILQCAMSISNSDGFLPPNEFNMSVKSKGIRVQIVKMLLDNGANIHASCKSNATVLHLAAVSGNIEMIETLLERKVDINATSDVFGTPLHAAVKANQKEAIEFLIKRGSNVNAKDHHCMSPLYYAITGNCKKVVRLLIKVGADVNADSYLAIAINCGFKNIAKILLRNKINIETNEFSQQNESLLHLAAQNGFKDIVEALIAKGMCVDATTDTGYAPLHFAAQEGHHEVVKELLAKEANLNPWCDQCGTPLHLAARHGHNSVVEILVSNGASVDIKDNENKTAIELATGLGHLKVVKVLLQCEGTNVNAKTNENWTVLHIASQKGKLEIIKCLIDAGSEIDAKDRQGSAPVHIAAREGHKHAVEFFLANGCHINGLGANEWTLLHYASSRGQLEMVKYLVEQTIHINSADANGSKPIHLAVAGGYEDVIKVLLINGAIYDGVDNFYRKPLHLAKSPSIIKLLTSVNNLFEAVKSNKPSDVEMCIKEGAFVNAKNDANLTQLHYACLIGYKRVVDILLKHKANPNLINKEGSTPLHYAAKFSHLDIVEALLSSGAKFNVLSHNFKTPSNLATDQEIVELLKLVEQFFEKIQNCDPNVLDDLKQIKATWKMKPILNARNREGRTLIVAAVCNDFPRIERLKQIFESNEYGEIDDILILFSQEKYEEALNISQSILTRNKELLGPDNPCTLNTQFIIANILYKQNKYTEAMNKFQETHEKQKALMGQNNKDTLRSRNGIALVLHCQGKYKEALEIFQEVYKRQQEVLGRSDVDTLDTQFNMALVLNMLGRYDEALCLCNDVLERTRVVGASYHVAFSVHDNIDIALRNRGKCDEAYKILKQVYEEKTQLLGAEHSYSLKTLYNMATVRFHQGRYDEALIDYQKVFELQKRLLGSDHLDTLNTQCNIAKLFFMQGKLFHALKAYKDGFDQRLSILGPDHPSILETRMQLKLLNSMLKTEGCNVTETMNI